MDLLKRAKAVIENKFDNIRKAAMTTADLVGGGLLLPQQSKQFIRLLRMQPFLLRAIRMVALKGQKGEVNRIQFADRILHAATENTALTAEQQAKPATSKIEMDTKLFKAEVPISYEVLQDNIEGGVNVRGNDFENLIFQLIAERVALDIEDYSLNSDVASVVPDYAQFDGWLKVAEATNTYDHGGAAVNKALFKKLCLATPSQYRQNKKANLYVAGSNTEMEWQDELVDAGHTTFSQKVAWGDGEAKVAYSSPLLVSGFIPEALGAGNIGKLLYTHPKNMILGLWRNIFMEVDRDIRTSTLIVVVSLRLDAKFEQPEGAAVATNFIVE